MKNDISETSALKREAYRRFVYIETCLYWGQGVTATSLGRTFHIARQNAQASIDRYRTLYPENMVYNASVKRHLAGDAFEPRYISKNPLRYLDYLRGNSLANHFWEDEEWGHLPVEDVDHAFRPSIDGGVARTVVSAIQEQQTLALFYHSKTVGYEHLNISPHSLVYASGRYHIRAYCFDRNRFIDLVLSRIIEAEQSIEDWISGEEDHQWNTYIELLFTPNPELPEPVQTTLRMDYAIAANIYRVKTRVAIQGYIIREMERLDWKHKIPLWLQVTGQTTKNTKLEE